MLKPKKVNKITVGPGSLTKKSASPDKQIKKVAASCLAKKSLGSNKQIIKMAASHLEVKRATKNCINKYGTLLKKLAQR